MEPILTMVEGEVKFEGINNMQSKRYLVLEDGSFTKATVCDLIT